ncbi:MAG: nucleoside deaminase [Calditrichaeota bacterium]|nr:MAG: nucleoside deaminase [Calditrichota bacterium]
MCRQPDSVTFHLPEWIAAFCHGYTATPQTEERMRFVIEASQRNVEAGTGGPFAAAVFEHDSGRLIALGVNLVTSEKLSVLHAEIVAISLAQRQCATYDLSAAYRPAYELVTSTEPCAMCLGAIPWSGVRYVVSGAREEDARAIGFDEGPKPDNWVRALESRRIAVITDIHRDRARAVLQQYARGGGAIYNAGKKPPAV